MSIRTLSVSSRRRHDGSRPLSPSTWMMTSTMSGCISCLLDRLIDMDMPRATSWSACHSTICRQASSMTQTPIGTIRPVSSATEMISPGRMSPRSGCCQRSSASKPTTRSVASAITGW